MRAKKLGRHELLSWINNVTQSDYYKIENLSDGVGLCQLFDAYYPNNVNLNQLKCKIIYMFSKFKKYRGLGKKLDNFKWNPH